MELIASLPEAPGFHPHPPHRAHIQPVMAQSAPVSDGAEAGAGWTKGGCVAGRPPGRGDFMVRGLSDWELSVV